MTGNNTWDERMQREKCIEQLEAISKAYTKIREAMISTAEQMAKQHAVVRQHLAEVKAGGPLRELPDPPELPQFVAQAGDGAEELFTPEFRARYEAIKAKANAPKAEANYKVVEQELEGAAKHMCPGDPIEFMSDEQAQFGPAVGYCIANDGNHLAIQFAPDAVQEFCAPALKVLSAVLPVDERNGRTVWRLK